MMITFTKFCWIFLSFTQFCPQSNQFGRHWHRPTLEANINFSSEIVLSTLFKSIIECTSVCDITSWCGGIIWDETSNTCTGLQSSAATTPVPPNTNPLFVPFCTGVGYTYEAEICVRFYESIRITWSAAQQFCQERGGRLAVVDTSVKFDYISNEALTTYQGRTWWLGATKDNSTLVWSWTTGKTVTRNIVVNSPQDSFCLEMYLGHFDDVSCESTRNVLCELLL